ncbi:MAG: type II toxin-antitoxin system VapC family toxin [Candidatus Entotheonellia bacterium]
MSDHILDTDHVSLFQRGYPQVVAHVLAHPADRLVVTIVTVEEQLRGRLSQIRRASSGPSRIQAYARLHELVDFFSEVRILDFDTMANTRYEALRQQRIRIGIQDLRIAAIVLSVSGILVTRNAGDFRQVPDLLIEDWSHP